MRQSDHRSNDPDDAVAEHTLRAGELAKLAGVSTDTLRYYEREGVLPPPRRRANGYRDYSLEALRRVRVIRAGLAIGFTLGELRPLLRSREQGRPPCRAVRELAATKLRAAEEQLVELEQLISLLRTTLDAWDSKLLDASPGAALGLLEGLSSLPSHRRRAPRRRQTITRTP